MSDGYPRCRPDYNRGKVKQRYKEKFFRLQCHFISRNFPTLPMMHFEMSLFSYWNK